MCQMVGLYRDHIAVHIKQELLRKFLVYTSAAQSDNVGWKDDNFRVKSRSCLGSLTLNSCTAQTVRSQKLIWPVTRSLQG